MEPGLFQKATRLWNTSFEVLSPDEDECPVMLKSLSFRKRKQRLPDT